MAAPATLAVAVVAALVPGRAGAGGLSVYELGTPDMFTASAGWAARAQDAATILTNPAGMARLGGGDLLLSLQALYGDLQFAPNANTTTTGGDGGNPVGWFPGGGAFYAREMSESLWLGFGVGGTFGLVSEYESGWVGRHYIEKGTLIGVSLLPSVAYRLTPQVSLGASLNAMFGVFQADVAVNNIAPSEPDGRLSLDTTDWGFGGNFGVLWEPCEATRAGVTYTMPVPLGFTDLPDFTGLGPGLESALRASGLLDADLTVDLKAPQGAMASFYHELRPQWTLLGNLGWQDWSRFGKVGIEVASDATTSLTADRKYKDTWHGALGVQHRLGDSWRVSAGSAYDSSMMEDEDRTIDLPLGPAWRFAAGAQHALSDKLDLGFGYTFAWSGDLPVDENSGPLTGRVAGSFEGTAIHFFGANAHWKL